MQDKSRAYFINESVNESNLNPNEKENNEVR